MIKCAIMNLQSLEERLFMGKISTKEIMDGYYKSIEGTSMALQRATVDKPALYEYENIIGKELIDMDVDDLIGLIVHLKNTRKGKQIRFLITHSSIDNIVTVLRALFDWYIYNVEVIINPLNDKRMKGKALLESIAKNMEPFNWDYVKEIISLIHVDKESDYADYLELILLMFHDGFATAQEIIMLKEEQIDHRHHTAKLIGKTVNISDRCYELLMKFHDMEIMNSYHKPCFMLGWHGGFFKFPVMKKKEDEVYDVQSRFNDRTLKEVSDIIPRLIMTHINDQYETKINYINLYYLGFYDYLVGKYGLERTQQILTSSRNSADINELMTSARMYGVTQENVSHLKRYLRPFIVVADQASKE